MNNDTIDWIQFNDLIRAIESVGQTDWNEIKANFIGQLIIAILATFGAYFFQRISEKKLNAKLEVQEAYRFNEAVGYFGAVLENISTHIDQLVLPAFKEDINAYVAVQVELEELRKGKEPKFEGYSFKSIRALEVFRSEELASRIPQLGKYFDIINIFHRLRYEILQFNM